MEANPSYDTTEAFIQALQYSPVLRGRFQAFCKAADRFERQVLVEISRQLKHSDYAVPEHVSLKPAAWYIRVPEPENIHFNQAFGHWQGLRLFLSRSFSDFRDFCEQLEDNQVLQTEMLAFLMDAQRFTASLATRC